MRIIYRRIFKVVIGMDNKILSMLKTNKDYFEDFITRSVSMSNRIEGSTLSYVETYAILWNDNSFPLKDMRPRDFYEAVNLKYAINMMLDAINKEEKLSQALIIKLNETINKNILDTQGYRKVQVYIRGAAQVPPPPIEIRERMMYLLENYHNNTLLPLMKKIAQFHIDFEHLHPFEDGNGRCGRLLINFELMKRGQAPVIIPDNRRIEYFNFISDYNTEGMAKMFSELQQNEIQRMNQFQAIERGKHNKRIDRDQKE